MERRLPDQDRVRQRPGLSARIPKRMGCGGASARRAESRGLRLRSPETCAQGLSEIRLSMWCGNERPVQRRAPRSVAARMAAPCRDGRSGAAARACAPGTVDRGDVPSPCACRSLTPGEVGEPRGRRPARFCAASPRSPRSISQGDSMSVEIQGMGSARRAVEKISGKLQVQ